MSRSGYRAFALALFAAASMLDACGGTGGSAPRVIATPDPTSTPPATSTPGTPKPSPTPSPTPTGTPTSKPSPTAKPTRTPKPTPTPFDNVPASVAFGAAQDVVVAGESRTFDVSAALVNAEGKQIKTDFTPGVNLSVSGDANGTLALSQTSLVKPSTRVRVAYDGGPLAGLSETFGSLTAPYAVLTPSVGNTTFRIGSLAVYLNGAAATAATLDAKGKDTLEVVEAFVDGAKPLEFTVKTSNATIVSSGIATFAIASANDVPVALPVTAVGAGNAKISIGGAYVKYAIEFTVK